MATILIVDDEPNILVTLSRALKLEGYQTKTAESAQTCFDKLALCSVDLVLLDVRLQDMDGLSVLEKIRGAWPVLPVVMMSGHATVEVAVKAVQIGALDFLEKPLSTNKVLITVANALKMSRLTEENRDLKAIADLQTEMVGNSPAMQALFDQIRLAAPSNGRVLITGESGTGKELVARAIHENSHREKGPFIKVNCAAVPNELIESELFGHEKGSFTGASQQRRGKFELADSGTLFLDEIGDMPLNMQAKLLRILQEGEFERVGSGQTLRVDVRVIAATNQRLDTAIANGTFRQDLYYRLNVVPIQVPPLRQRKEDISILAEHFLQLACQQNGRRIKSLSKGTLDLLTQHDYPGNVRELKNSIERLIIMVPGKTIEPTDISRLLGIGAFSTAVKAQEPNTFYQPGLHLKEMLLKAEHALICKALDDNLGHITNTAKHLGLERSHLYKKMKALGIK